MATNPMQKKTRTAFILGMLLMLVIAAAVVAFLYMQIQNQKKELIRYQQSSRNVCVLSQDVKSGQVLTPEMFTQIPVATNIIPSGATTEITTTLSSYSLSTKDGRPIYYNTGTPGNAEDPAYYYVGTATDKHPIYVAGDTKVSVLKPGDKAYFYAQANNQGKTDVEISENAVVAKVDMTAKTVITNSLIARTDEITTDDLRKEEYNVISLPVDLAPEEYVDVRLVLPNGQNYIVVSKKRVSIPMSNGVYLDDTIQMNLSEEEILIMSCAIVENYKIKGSKLYATRYTEAGIQEAATKTYTPNNYVINLIKNDPNIVSSAIKGLESRNADIDRAISENGQEGEERAETKVEQSITSSREARKNYLQSLTDTTTTVNTTN